jgi:energy-coupling factor transporter ATP-binding protein EcfA2
MRRPACEHVFHQWIQRQAEHSVNSSPNFTLNSSQCLFITGSHGIGKTQWVKEMCEGIGHRILWLTPDKCETSSQMESMLKKLFSTIDTVFDDFPLKDYTIVIDDWETMIANDRSMFLYFQQSISKSIANPHGRRIISIGNLAMEKRFREIKQATLISMYPLDERDICLFLRAEFPMLSTGLIASIAEMCEGNLRHALETAGFEKTQMAPAQTAIPNKKYQLSLPTFVYETTHKLPTIHHLFQLKSSHEGYLLVQQDPWMIPLRFHENLLKDMENRKGTQAQKIKAYDRFLSNILTWDYFMATSLHKDSIHGFPMDSISHITGTLLYATQTYPPYLKKPKHPITDLTDFTKMLSQLSLHKKQIHGFYDRYKGSHYPIYDYPSHWFMQ